MMKEAGNDVAKKSAVVNQVAETISKLNKAEDFTRQQDYIRQSAHLLKIDETGLTHLVNKLKRDKVAKDEKKKASDDLIAEQELAARQPEDVLDDAPSLFNKDEAHERNVLRALLEHGLLPWDDQMTMAEYVFTELDQFHFDNPLLEELFETYKKMFVEGQNPTTKSMLYHSNESVRNLVIQLSMQAHELSTKWDEIMEGMNILNRNISHQDILMSVNYYKLRKLKKMFEENQRDMENAPLEEQMRLIELHQHLKTIEREITKQLGTVIIR